MYRTFMAILLQGVLFISSSNLTAQDTIRQSDVPEEVENYINFLISYDTYEKWVKDMDTMSIDRLKQLAKLMYEASEANAVLTAKIIYEKNSEFRPLESKYQKPSMVYNSLYDKIFDQLSPLIYNLVFPDYLLKVNIIEIFQEDHLRQFKAKILEVFKGKSEYSIGDEVMFHVGLGWPSGKYEIETGKNYFVPLKNYWYKNSPNTRLLTVINKKYNEHDRNGSFGRFPLIDGYLIDSDNTWGFGEKVEWKEFEYKIKQAIDSIIGKRELPEIIK